MGSDGSPDGLAPEVKNGEFQWTLTAQVDGDRLRGLPPGQIVAWVEEIEYRLPATYPAEPVTLDQAYDAQMAQPSGPRFLARVPFRAFPLADA